MVKNLEILIQIVPDRSIYYYVSKFKNIFAKGYTPNWSREIFIVNKINDTVPYTYNLKDLNDEEIIGSFYDRELQKTIL